MLYIVCALYCEGAVFIENLGLKKAPEYKKYQVFKNDHTVLLITGTGSIQSAAAVAAYLSLNPPKDTDILINIGVCGCTKKTAKVGEIFLCDKITDISSKKSYYPDILYSHSLEEKEIISFPKVCTQLEDGFLADMEAVGIYLGAVMFFSPHQMIFIKIVSDNLDKTPVSPALIKGLIKKNYEKITLISENALKALQPFKSFNFSDEELSAYNSLCDILKLTVSMKLKLKQLLYYYKLRENKAADENETNSLLKFLLETEAFLKNALIKNKSERKKYFDYISKKLI